MPPDVWQRVKFVRNKQKDGLTPRWLHYEMLPNV